VVVAAVGQGGWRSLTVEFFRNDATVAPKSQSLP
jgi:hypothetical protein